MFADVVVAELDNNPDAAVLFQDYHLYLAPGYVRAARPDAKLAHFVHIPWPVDWTILPEAMRRAVHDGPARERRRRHSTPRAGRGTSRRAAPRSRRLRAHARDAPRDLDRHRRVRRARDSRSDVLAAERGSRRPGRRSSCSASTAPTRRRTSCAASRRSASCSTLVRSGAAASRCSRCSIRHGSRSPSTSTYVAAIERTTEEVNARHPRRDRAAGRGRLPAVGRCVQAVRRAARERGVTTA